MRVIEAIGEIEDELEEEIEYTDVHFSPAALNMIERLYADEIVHRIKDYKWGQSYFNNDGERKFTITFALGIHLEIRVAIGTTINVILRGINVLPGGQESLLNPKLSDTVITLLRKFHRNLLSNVLVPMREVIKWRSDIKKWKRDTFNYDIPDHLLFFVPSNEVECLSRSTTTRLVYQDRLTKAIVEIEGKDEDTSLLDQRARSKLFIMRELREL